MVYSGGRLGNYLHLSHKNRFFLNFTLYDKAYSFRQVLNLFIQNKQTSLLKFRSVNFPFTETKNKQSKPIHMSSNPCKNISRTFQNDQCQDTEYSIKMTRKWQRRTVEFPIITLCKIKSVVAIQKNSIMSLSFSTNNK